MYLRPLSSMLPPPVAASGMAFRGPERDVAPWVLQGFLGGHASVSKRKWKESSGVAHNGLDSGLGGISIVRVAYNRCLPPDPEKDASIAICSP